MSERARALEQAREWQAIAYGDRPETWAALDYYRELGWPVDSNKFPERERVEGRIFAFMSGYREALKAAVDPPPSGASPQADELGQALVNFMVDLESAQVELPPEVATVLRENRWDLYEGAPVAPASPQAETSEDMGDGWYVTVGRFGASFVTLEETHMGGKPYLTPEDKALVRGAALHLLAFIGSPAPVSPVEPEPPTVECCACGHLNTPQQATRLEGEWRSSGEYVCLDSDACSRRIAKCSEPTVEPELPTRLAICDVCVTAAHCSQHWRCLAECKPNDLRVKTNPCVWRITTGPLGTWVKPTCVEGSIPAPWGTERAKACHLCGAPLKVER